MYQLRRILSFKIFITLASLKAVLCSIDGSFIHRRRNATRFGEDPCNPLYWYPRHIPEYCYFKKEMTTQPPVIPKEPIPMPIPVPIPPIPLPIPPMPMPPMPIPMPMPPNVLPPIMPQPMMPLPFPLPFGIPLAPTNPMLPVAFLPPHPPFYTPPSPFRNHIMSPFTSYVPPFGIQRRPMSMVPGLPGLVAPDGGINILPFTDAYADLLEKHKQKMIRKRLQKLLDEYDGWPSRNSDEDIGRYGRSNDINAEEHF